MTFANFDGSPPASPTVSRSTPGRCALLGVAPWHRGPPTSGSFSLSLSLSTSTPHTDLLAYVTRLERHPERPLRLRLGPSSPASGVRHQARAIAQGSTELCPVPAPTRSERDPVEPSAQGARRRPPRRRGGFSGPSVCLLPMPRACASKRTFPTRPPVQVVSPDFHQTHGGRRVPCPSRGAAPPAQPKPRPIEPPLAGGSFGRKLPG